MYNQIQYSDCPAGILHTVQGLIFLGYCWHSDSLAYWIEATRSHLVGVLFMFIVYEILV